MKNIADEELGPSICPELSSNVIQTILEINAGLIKVCVEFQNKGWTSDPDFAIYQSRLQSNLAYLAAVADHYLKPERKLTDLPPKPNLTPLPDPRTVSAQMLKKLISKAKNDFENVDTQSLTKVLQRDTEAGKQVERDIKRREEDNKTSRLLSEELDLPVHISKRVLDPQASSENYQNFVPFPPLQLPEGISDPLVPPHLPEGEENGEVDNAPSADVENDVDMMQTDSDEINQSGNDSNNGGEEEDNTTITNTTPRPEELVNRLVNQMFEQNINSNEDINNIEDLSSNAVGEVFETKEEERLANELLNFPEEKKTKVIEEAKKSKSSVIRELIEQIGYESSNNASEKSS